MKVLLITHLVPYPPRGGVIIRNFNLLREVSKRHDVDLLTFSQQAHFSGREDEQRCIEETRRYCRHLEVFDIPTDGHRLAWYRLLFLNLFSRTPYSAWRFSSPAMTSAIKQRLCSENYDVMEIGTIGLAHHAALAPDLPKVLVHHNVESHLLQRRSKLAPGLPARWYLSYQANKLRDFEQRAGDVIDYHTTCSEDDKRLLKEIAPSANVEVVPNGVDTDYFRPTDEPEQPGSMVYVGGLNWFPNRDAMVWFAQEIWPRLKTICPDANMNYIGKGTDQRLTTISQRDQAFRLHGFVDDIRPCVGESAVYVVPIRVGGGTRLKILDAMAMGKAIVSTTVGCEGIHVVDGEDIIIADDPESFAGRTAELLGDVELRRRLGRNARRKAEQEYAWSVIAPKLEHAYELAIEHRRRS